MKSRYGAMMAVFLDKAVLPSIPKAYNNDKFRENYEVQPELGKEGQLNMLIMRTLAPTSI